MDVILPCLLKYDQVNISMLQKMYRFPNISLFFFLLFLLSLKKLAVCPGISNTLDFADCVPVMLFNVFLCRCKL